MDQRSFKNINSAQDAQYKRSRNYALTRQMLQHRTDRMTVISSRGYGRKEYVTSKQTGPSMQKRRYSIDVTTAEGWGNWPTTGTRLNKGHNKVHTMKKIPSYFYSALSADADQQPEVLSKHGELEPIALQRENIPPPNPLRHASLQRRLRVMHPPHNSDTYLALEESSLENKYFNYILDYSGDEAWMDDSILNMALECLRRKHACSAHGVDVINTNLVQSIRMLDMIDDTTSASSDFIRTRLQDKRWIFIPVNDGMDSESYSETRGGSHWYLILVDRVHKSTYYYDSMGMDDDRALLGFQISWGLCKILGDDTTGWDYLEQEHSPDQWDNNQSSWDKGACGPFVYSICDLFIGMATQCVRAGREQEWQPMLAESFPRWLKDNFHSVSVRRQMQLIIAHYKCLEESSRLMQEHDWLHGGSF